MAGESENQRAAFAKRAAEAVAAAALFLVLALVTRGMVMAFPAVYGLHAALCAPLFALAIVFYLRKGGSWPVVAIAFGVLALVLGCMRPLQMGLPFLVSALLAVTFGLVGQRWPTWRGFWLALGPPVCSTPLRFLLAFCPAVI